MISHHPVAIIDPISKRIESNILALEDADELERLEKICCK